MLLASVFRAISLQICRVPRIAGSDATLRRGAHRPNNSVPRRKPVRGAASEPHYTDARVDLPADSRAEIGFA
jgi:hypothetical protein